MFKWIMIMMIMIFMSCKSNVESAKKLTIAAAANMQYAVHDLATQFKDLTDIDCEIIISSSGKLTAQIIEGAPFDIFLSADMKYPMTLYQKGITDKKPTIYAYGKLALWTMKELPSPLMEILEKSEVDHIAIANPDFAPYGKSGKQVLNYYGLMGEVSDKLVYGESIAQVNQFIASGAADIGFTALSSVYAGKLSDKGKWEEVDRAAYLPIAQGLALLNDNPEAKSFLRFIHSQESKEILINHGYEVNE